MAITCFLPTTSPRANHSNNTDELDTQMPLSTLFKVTTFAFNAASDVPQNRKTVVIAIVHEEWTKQFLVFNNHLSKTSPKS